MLYNIMVVASFGALGAVSRYLVSQLPKWAGFPMGTIVVNLLGSLILGILVAWSWEQLPFSPLLKLGITTGFLGSFTTFSTFSVENAQLIQQGAIGVAIANIVLQLLVGLGLSLLGLWIGSGL